MAYHSRNPKLNSVIVVDESGTPANPPAGSTKLITRSGSIYTRNSSGTETQVLTGSAATQYAAKSADYTVTDSDNVRTVGMTTGSTNRTVTLPTAADNTHRVITVKKVDSGSGTVTVDGEGAETIDGATTVVLSVQYESVTVQCDGSGWKIIDGGVAATATRVGLVSTAAQSMAGVKTFNDGVKVASGGATLTSFVEADISINFDTGAFSGVSSQSITAKLTKIGKVCILYMPQILATTNGTSSTMSTTGTTLSAYVGSQRKRFPIITAKNGTLHQGVMRIETDGSVLVAYDTNESAAGWTSGDTNSGIVYQTVMWTTD